ncbi:unnamed protein product [Rhodiola kirilowii]
MQSDVQSKQSDEIDEGLNGLIQGEKLSSSICTVAVLGVDEAFKTLDQTAIQSFIDAFEIVEEEPAAEQEPATEEPAAPAEGVGQGGHLISHETKFHLFHVFIQNLDHLSDNCHDLVAILNIWRMWPLGQLVHQFMNAFTDHRDSDILIVSHFSLLLGCALPIWMSSGYNDRPLAPFAGILSLGIGDTMASMVGYKYGVLRWSKAGKKTIEGTAAGITSMLAACLTLLPLLASTGYLVTENWFPLLFAVTVSGLLEAYTAQLDNAFIPLPIRNIELMNDAMMLNQLWELSKEGQSLWIKWVHAYWTKGNALVEVWIGEGAGFNVNDTYLTLKSREEEVDWHSLVWNRFNTPSASFYA